MKCTVKDIVDFYSKNPQYIGYIEVLTRSEYKPIEYADITAYNSDVYEIKTETHRLQCSPEHRVWVCDDWKHVKNLSVGEEIHTDSGNEKITSIKLESFKEDLYDLQVAEVHEYYTNGITSHNSSFMDAITFALFGKPLRNINKPQLVNSKNNKELFVELVFDIDSTEYIIKRGIKPAIFEIYENGTLINQSAASIDYQEYLEKMILKMNVHTFTQTVILSKATFIPFMKLNLAQRRLFIENILGLEIFALMNELFKLDFNQTKETFSTVKTSLEILKNKADVQKTYLDKLKALVKKVEDESNTKRQSEIDSLTSELTALNEKISQLEAALKHLEITSHDVEEINDKIRSFEEIGHKASVRFSDADKLYQFFTTNDSCPTCSQVIIQSLKDEKIQDNESKKIKYETLISDCNEKVDLLKLHLQKLNVSLMQAKELNTKYKTLKSKKDQIEKELLSLSAETVPTNNNDEIKNETSKLTSIIHEMQIKISERNELAKEIEYATMLTTILKDGGIKAYVIKSYINTINTLISNNLTKLNFLVKFELDEEFKETILSRRIDTFSYFNFSEGEKLRIDLAIIIAWRELLKMRGSINTNLLIFDEILDGSIDAAGRDAMVDILNELSHTNLFVISHSDGVWNDKFRGRLEFANEQGFSKIKSKNI